MKPASVDTENTLLLIDAFEEAFEQKVDCAIGYEVLPLIIDALYKLADLDKVGISQ